MECILLCTIILPLVNSTYYPAHKFKTLNKNKSFNIFHTNLNGLENKIDQLQNFISTTTLNIDILKLSGLK